MTLQQIGIESLIGLSKDLNYILLEAAAQDCSSNFKVLYSTLLHKWPKNDFVFLRHYSE